MGLRGEWTSSPWWSVWGTMDVCSVFLRPPHSGDDGSRAAPPWDSACVYSCRKVLNEESRKVSDHDKSSKLTLTCESKYTISTWTVAVLQTL